MAKKIGIWGLGIVGKSAIRYFHRKGYTLELLDQRTPSSEEQSFLKEHQTSWFSNDQLHAFLERNELILPSCGIDLRPYTQFSHKFLAELDLFGAECKKPIIAITGSVGKTTVTHLLSHLLRGQNKKVFSGGNLGCTCCPSIGLLEGIDQANNADYVVIEVSSFQLERCNTFAPDFAICTNIFANHLDRHGNYQNYVDAKMKIIGDTTKQILFPISLFDDIPREIKQKSLYFFAPHLPSSQEFSLFADFHKLYYLHNSKLFVHYQTKDIQIFDFKELPFVSYLQNVVILASALHILNYSLSNFVEILNKQELPEHRLEKIATINMIDFYNDSKATIPASTLAAIQKIQHRPIVLFLGGVSKGVNRADFVKQIGNTVRFIYCFGKEAEQLKSFCDSNRIPAQAFATLDDAFNALPQVMQRNDQILFSPAGASFDLFANYAERGNYFKKLVFDLQSKY